MSLTYAVNKSTKIVVVSAKKMISDGEEMSFTAVTKLYGKTYSDRKIFNNT